jgi:hypothetical protein
MIGADAKVDQDSSQHPRVLPRLVIVAGFAVSPEAPAVFVVATMTGETLLGGSYAETARLRMTRLATQIFVSTCERKLGIAGVIENPDVPSIRIVTAGALGAESSLVGVVLGVTVHASGLRVAELRAGVAVLACDGRVQTQQRKATQIVIKEHLLVPGLLVVTDGTRALELASVNIVSRVTRSTIRDRFLLLRGRPVTDRAVDFGVCAQQLEARSLFVIESRCLPLLRGVAVIALDAQ